MADLIQKTDTLNDGREKLNEAIKDADTAKVDASTAKSTANQALAKSTDTQTQLDTIVIEGDSSVEAAQARVDTKGNPHTTLKARLDAEQTAVTSQLAVSENKTKLIGTTLNELNEPKNGIVSFITDDGSIQDITFVKPIFIQENVPCSTAVISSRINQSGWVSSDQLLELQNVYGWEIMSHTVDHPHLGDLSDTDQEFQLSESKRQIESYGLKCENIAYPYGSFNDSTKKIARKYYRSGRGTDYGLFGINYPPVDTFELKMLWLDSNAVINNDPSGFPVNTIEYYQYYIDKAYANNGWVIILCHSWNVEEGNLSDLLQQIVQYAKTKCEIATFSEALDRYGNIVDSGNKAELKPFQKHYAVGYNGAVSSNGFNSILAQSSTKTGSTPIADFENYKVTVNGVNTTTASSSGLPESTGGILYTYKIKADVEKNSIYNFQIYHVLYNGNVYKRVCKVDNTWDTWKLISPSFYLENINTLTCSTPITSFKTGITYNIIDSTTATATGSPENLGGTLKTFKIASASHGYNWQEYHIYKTNKTYTRYFDENGVASAWTEVTQKFFVNETTNAFTSATTIGTFPIGITYNKINATSASATGSPESLAGVLVTNKMHSTINGYNWQEYHIYGTAKVYKRSFADDGAPTSWSKISAV